MWGGLGPGTSKSWLSGDAGRLPWQGESFASMARFAIGYADQNDRDYQALLDAVADGRIEADQQG